MAATPSIYLSGWMNEHLEAASPDLLRATLSSYVEALMELTSTRSETPATTSAVTSEPTPATDTGNDSGTPALDRSTWRSLRSAQAPTSRSGCWSGVAEPRCADLGGRDQLAAGGSTRRMESSSARSGPTGSPNRRCRRWPRTSTRRFRTRPLDAWPYTFVASDALVLKVREGGRTVNVDAMVATGVNAEGYREILGLQVTSAEGGAGWLAFCRDLVARGLTGVRLVTSDAHAGLVGAVGATLPGASWQRCRNH
jgi:putative transposase